MGDPTPPPDRAWHVINGAHLLDLLRRAAAGEDPDVVYVEAWLRASREDLPGQGDQR